MNENLVVQLRRLSSEHHGITTEEIQHASKERLIGLQAHLGLGDRWGLMQVPPDWLPPGSTVVSHGTIRLTKTSVKNAKNEQEVELANLVLTRLALLFVLAPPFQTRSMPLSIRTVVEAISVIQKSLIQPALLMPAGLPGVLLGRFDLSLVDKYSPGASARVVETRTREVRRLRALSARGLWNDLPSEAHEANFEKTRKFQPELETVDDRVGTHLPFSDEFVAEAGWRAAWITENLAMPLTQVAEQLHAQKRCLPTAISEDRLRTAEERLLDRFPFHDKMGKEIRQLPFRINHGKRNEWPPKNSAHVHKLLEVVQSAHLFIVLLSTGGRISEVLSLMTDCLIDTAPKDGPTLAQGRTFKLVYAHEGKSRDWPLPELAIQAVRNQSRMVKLAHTSTATQSLWCGFVGERLGQKLSNYRGHLNNFVSRLGLKHLLGDQNMRSHRFRKTIARLVALAVAEAPKVLMDIFGHKSITMTMRYILADPIIRSEMDTVRRELVVMFAAKAIENAQSNGGPAAAPLKRAISEAQIRTGFAWGQDNIRELAFTLTANGDHWTLVRPGVLCTKLPSQSGPCNANQSAPDPARCRTSCSHRLEDASARDEANRCIQQAVELAYLAADSDNEIEKELWMGQILAHVHRFDDLKEIWRIEPIVASLLNKEEIAA